MELTHTVSGGDYSTDVDAPGVKVTVPVTGAPSAPTGPRGGTRQPVGDLDLGCAGG